MQQALARSLSMDEWESVTSWNPHPRAAAARCCDWPVLLPHTHEGRSSSERTRSEDLWDCGTKEMACKVERTGWHHLFGSVIALDVVQLAGRITYIDADGDPIKMVAYSCNPYA